MSERVKVKRSTNRLINKGIIMKKYLSLLILTIAFVSCTENARTGVSDNNQGTSDETTVITITDDNTSTSSCTGTGLTCNGDTSDGCDGNKGAIHVFEPIVAGTRDWVPGGPQNFPTNTWIYDTQVTSMSSKIAAFHQFNTDATLKVRFKILEQPSLSASPNNHICDGRKLSGIAKPAYSKLHFQLGLKHLRCNLPAPYNVNCVDQNGQTLDSYFTLDQNPYHTRTVSTTAGEGIGVNQCSSVIDLSGSVVPGGQGAVTVVEVKRVQSDSLCKHCQIYNCTGSITDHYCDQDGEMIDPWSCYRMKVQVVTDSTNDFK